MGAIAFVLIYLAVVWFIIRFFAIATKGRRTK